MKKTNSYRKALARLDGWSIHWPLGRQEDVRLSEVDIIDDDPVIKDLRKQFSDFYFGLWSFPEDSDGPDFDEARQRRLAPVLLDLIGKTNAGLTKSTTVRSSSKTASPPSFRK